MLRIVLMLLFSFSVIFSLIRAMGKECIEGEVWYEDCRKCLCLKNNEVSCEDVSNCVKTKCKKNATTFAYTERCHCVGETTVCVDLKFQKGLEGKPCFEDYYVYDTCTFCKCNTTSNLTQCFPVDCSILSGGLCNVGEVIVQNVCYECTCTFTKFRKCVPKSECLQEINKPGKCPKIHYSFPESFRKFCIPRILQDCYRDFACRGKEKCCQVTDCFLKCVIPQKNT